MSTHPNPSTTCKKSDVKCWTWSDSSHLLASKARSRVGGNHFLGNIPDVENTLEDQRTFVNSPFCIEASILNSVVGEFSEAEVAAACANARQGVPHSIDLMELDHPQHQTPQELDNYVARGIPNNTLMPKWSKEIDMRYFWLKERENQKQFKLHWEKCINSLADYFTKYYPKEHHCNMIFFV